MRFFFRKPHEETARKNYDRMHRKIEGLEDIENRVELLRMLEKIEPSLLSLENTHMNDYDKKKLMNTVNSDLKKVDLVLGGIKGRKGKFSI